MRLFKGLFLLSMLMWLAQLGYSYFVSDYFPRIFAYTLVITQAAISIFYSIGLIAYGIVLLLVKNERNIS